MRLFLIILGYLLFIPLTLSVGFQVTGFERPSNPFEEVMVFMVSLPFLWLLWRAVKPGRRWERPLACFTLTAGLLLGQLNRTGVIQELFPPLVLGKAVIAREELCAYDYDFVVLDGEAWGGNSGSGKAFEGYPYINRCGYRYADTTRKTLKGGKVLVAEAPLYQDIRLTTESGDFRISHGNFIVLFSAEEGKAFSYRDTGRNPFLDMLEVPGQFYGFAVLMIMVTLSGEGYT